MIGPHVHMGPIKKYTNGGTWLKMVNIYILKKHTFEWRRVDSKVFFSVFFGGDKTFLN